MNTIEMEREKLKKEALIMDYSRRLKMRIREEFKGNKVQIMIMNEIIDILNKNKHLWKTIEREL
jgi:hypothetical protein